MMAVFHVLSFQKIYQAFCNKMWCLNFWLVVLGLTALLDNISVYIGPSPREREKEKTSDR